MDGEQSAWTIQARHNTTPQESLPAQENKMKTQNATIIALVAMFTKADKAIAAAASNGERYSPEIGLEVKRKGAATEALKTLGVPLLEPYVGMVVVARDGAESRVIYVGLDGEVLVQASYSSRMWSGDVLGFSEEFTPVQLPEGCEH